MKTALGFLHDENGQDLIEYTLLITFIALASASILLSAGQSTGPIWSNASTELTHASAVAAGRH